MFHIKFMLKNIFCFVGKNHRKIKYKKFSFSLSIIFFKFQAVVAMQTLICIPFSRHRYPCGSLFLRYPKIGSIAARTLHLFRFCRF